MNLIQRTLLTVPLFFVIIMPPESHAQALTEDIKFTNISIKDGLSQSSANCIFQDSKGIIWIGTEDGLNKYDGYSFMVYKPLPNDASSISNARILSISEDISGNLWIGTNGGGLNQYDISNDKFHRVKNENGSASATITSMIHLDETILVGTNHGLMAVDASTREFTSIPGPLNGLQNLPQKPVRTMLLKENVLWLGTADGLYRFDIEKNNLTGYTNIGEDQNSVNITSLYIDRFQNLVIGSESKVFSLEIQTGIFSEVKLPGLNSVIKAIIDDNTGNIWIATFGNGIYVGNLQSGKFTNYQYDHLNPYSIRNNEVLSLFRDYSGLIWAGSNGLDIYNPLREKFELYDYVPYSKEKLVFRNIHPIYQDGNNVLWIGSKTDGIHQLDRIEQKYTHFTTASGLSSNRIRAIREYPEGKLWIGTEDAGLDMISLTPARMPGRITNFRPVYGDNSSLNSNTVYSIYPDGQGNIWIGTDNGLAVMNIESGKIKRYLPDSSDKKSISHLIVYNVFGDSKGNIWLATDMGVNRYEPATDGFIHYFHSDTDSTSIVHNEILCFHEDRNGSLWIGTYGKGFDKLDLETGRFVHFGHLEGISTAVIYGILEDEKGDLWMSSNNGILRFNEKSGELKQFTIEDGLQSNEFNGTSYFISKQGEMFFGGQFGFNSFFPQGVKVDTSVPKIVLSELIVHNRTILPGEESPLKQHINIAREINLDFRQNNFTLYFSALHFGNAERNRYKYMLEGFDKDWIDAGTKRFVTYTNLPYKTYRFRVIASNSDGIWNETGISVKIRVHPPLWATTSFRLLAVLIIAGGAYFIIRQQITRKDRQKKNIEEKLNRASSELDNARSQLENQRAEIVIQKRELAVRQKDQENLLWFNQGLGVFSDIISKNRDNLTLLCKEFIEKLTEYVEAQQGGIFLLNNEDETYPHLELMSSYAFSASRQNQSFALGEGYVGVCFKDKKFIEADNLSEAYSEFGSGLGRVHIKHLVLAPLLVVNDCVGVIELGSFKKIKGYKITFIEKIAENFASTVLTGQANARLKRLIDQSQKQAQELYENEENIRNSLEELMAAREESTRREDELILQAEEAATREEMLTAEIESLKKQLEKLNPTTT